MRLLLASNSPRRRQLLSQLVSTEGLVNDVKYISIDVDEHIDTPLPAAEVAEYLARRKASAFGGKLAADEVLVTADTVVVLSGHVMGKPADRAEAVAMLKELSGKRHTVYTGVCLRSSYDSGYPLCEDNIVSFTEATNVYFSTLDDNDISYYVDTYRPYDKAGAYGIQEWIGMIGIDRIDGCYYNVMGLPVHRIYKTLKIMVKGYWLKG